MKNMKLFFDAKGNLHAFEADGSQDAFINPAWTPTTEAEAEVHLAKLQETHEQNAIKRILPPTKYY